MPTLGRIKSTNQASIISVADNKQFQNNPNRLQQGQPAVQNYRIPSFVILVMSSDLANFDVLARLEQKILYRLRQEVRVSVVVGLNFKVQCNEKSSGLEGLLAKSNIFRYQGHFGGDGFLYGTNREAIYSSEILQTVLQQDIDANYMPYIVNLDCDESSLAVFDGYSDLMIEENMLNFICAQIMYGQAYYCGDREIEQANHFVISPFGYKMNISNQGALAGHGLQALEVNKQQLQDDMLIRYRDACVGQAYFPEPSLVVNGMLVRHIFKNNINNQSYNSGSQLLLWGKGKGESNAVQFKLYETWINSQQNWMLEGITDYLLNNLCHLVETDLTKYIKHDMDYQPNLIVPSGPKGNAQHSLNRKSGLDASISLADDRKGVSYLPLRDELYKELEVDVLEKEQVQQHQTKKIQKKKNAKKVSKANKKLTKQQLALLKKRILQDRLDNVNDRKKRVMQSNNTVKKMDSVLKSFSIKKPDTRKELINNQDLNFQSSPLSSDPQSFIHECQNFQIASGLMNFMSYFLVKPEWDMQQSDNKKLDGTGNCFFEALFDRVQGELPDNMNTPELLRQQIMALVIPTLDDNFLAANRVWLQQRQASNVADQVQAQDLPELTHILQNDRTWIDDRLMPYIAMALQQLNISQNGFSVLHNNQYCEFNHDGTVTFSIIASNRPVLNNAGNHFF